MKIYFLETGILLDESNTEYEKYSGVYDRKHGFYDECQEYLSSFEKAVKEAEVYVQNGIENTYAVISEFETDCVYVEDELDNLDLPGTGYRLEDVVFSLVKRENCLVRDFLGKL